MDTDLVLKLLELLIEARNRRGLHGGVDDLQVALMSEWHRLNG
jgi:hypothetical protein